MNKAKKIAAGWWEFMGFEIEQMEQGHWLIKVKGELNFCDGAETLKEAKQMIVNWTAQGNGA